MVGRIGRKKNFGGFIGLLDFKVIFLPELGFSLGLGLRILVERGLLKNGGG